MAIQIKDYYEILGISRDAGDEEVRRAFRKLARQYHPDRSGGDRVAEDRFKEINEAYEVLGDSKKRHLYDEFNSTYRNRSADEAWDRFSRAHGGSSTSRGDTHFTFSNNGGFSEFFNELFGERGQRSTPRRAETTENSSESRGDDLEADIWVSLNEVATGAIRQVSMHRAARCESCLGMGQMSGRKCEACNGSGALPATISCKVKVPQGVSEGSLLRIPGKGEEGLAGGQPGDLYLKVRYSAHSEFRSEHGVLVYDLEVAPWEAVLGADLSVPTLDGRVNIRVPPGTRSGHKLRVRGRGLPNGAGGAGDLLVHIKIQVPAEATERQRALWEELARESGFNPRDN